MSRNDRRRLELAARAAQRSDCKHTLGAILVAGGRVLATASNRSRNSASTTERRHCTTHAEEAVLRIAGDAAAGATLYVARVNRSGGLDMARPCARCDERLRTARVSRVVYSDRGGLLSAFRPSALVAA